MGGEFVYNYRTLAILKPHGHSRLRFIVLARGKC